MTTILNPATQESLGEVREATRADVDHAVARAGDAQARWAAEAIGYRARSMRRIADTIRNHLEELALLETDNVGKPIADSRGEVSMVADTFDYYAGAVDKLVGQSIPVDGGVDFTLREPMGVVAVIAPWNFPLAIASWNIAAALACGNAVIVKPAEITPLSTLRLVELVDDLDLPAGLLQCLTGKGSIVGHALTEVAGVDKISFTGSTEVGKQISEVASGTLKRLTLELGGKSASVVFADADIERAARASVGAVFGNSGQDCCARSRMYVQREVFDQYLKAFADASRVAVMGSPRDESTTLGPLVSAQHHAKVSSFLSDDIDFVELGAEPEGPGNWFAPRIAVAPDRTHRLVEDEVFGPIATVLPFDTEEEAIREANNSIYGLSGSVWSGDGARALRVARGIRSGSISINSNTSVRIQTPFGGMKQSGVGRELGLAALDSYTELKNIFFATE
ncbi:aldehyde dehydrogenase family protein [Nocardioides aurantiacus]|uniref:aldehyde dehydrogenase family protein n=1 Tax=Nocardioides aurantiacus TaxID=86796 RepID=UPI00403F0477